MITTSRRLTSAIRLLPAALLVAGLVLGGPSLTEDPSFGRSWAMGGTGTGVGQENPQCPPQGCIHTGGNENVYDPAGGLSVMAD